MSEGGSSSIGFVPTSGLGDQLLDTIGFVVYCQYKDATPVLEWNKNPAHFSNMPWGVTNFCASLFDFSPHVMSVDKLNDRLPVVVSALTGASLSPVKMADALIASNASNASNASKERKEIYDAYRALAPKLIKPGDSIRFGPELQRCIGIHLRRSDKIKRPGEGCDHRHETTIGEYEIILARLKDCLRSMIVSHHEDSEVWFFVCSEEKAFREDFVCQIEEMTLDCGKTPRFYDPPTIVTHVPGAEAATDLFSLSRCKCILQGIKYSTFSTVAHLIGRNKLYNFGDHDMSTSILRLWKPILDLNNNDTDNESEPVVVDANNIPSFYVTHSQ